MNFSVVRYIVGCLLKFEAGFLLLPCIVSLICSEPSVSGIYLLTAAACLCLGFLLTFRKPKQFQIYTREGFTSVALGWVVLSVFGAMPFLLTGEIPHFEDALFEVISGFTTTGASILSDVESLSKGNLFWRSFTHWIGGMGVFVFIMAVLPLMGSSNMNLMRAESPGPSVGKLVPRVKDTAKILYEIYIAITIIQIVLMCLEGLPVLDSMMLTFGTVGTGGFGILNDGLASYSPAIQNTVTVFMILSGINYSFFFCLLSKQFKEAFSLEEVRWYLGIILASALLIAGNTYSIYQNVGETLRHAFFQVGSIITTTGYSTTDFDQWPQFSKTILVLLMILGACAGSTGGGFKVSRLLFLLKSIKKELGILIHPRMVKKLSMDGHQISHDVLRSTNVFMAAYFLILFSSMLLISVDNLDLTTNFTAVIATLSNIGPGLAKVGPTQNFSVYSCFSKYVLMFDMLAGRLELLPILILFMPSCWKKY